MGNSVRGIVTTEIGGKTYTCRLGVNEWCELEDQLGKSTEKIQSDIRNSIHDGNMSLRTLRAIFCASVQSSHPEVNLQIAGDLMTEIGMLDAIALVASIMRSALPDPQPEEGSEVQPGKRKNPPRK